MSNQGQYLTLTGLLTNLGLVSLGFVFIRIASFVWLYFIRSSALPKYAIHNAYALVTGASDGIGRAFAHELAARGFNVILHGRNPTKLNVVKESIEAAYPRCKIRVVIADASDGAKMRTSVEAVAKKLRESLDGPLTVLLNNCGGTSNQHSPYATFEELSFEEMDGTIDLNARFHVHLTRALLPLLLAVEGPDAGIKGRPALIMYTGSIAGRFPGPWLTLYSASKAFGNMWMIALGREMRELHPNVEVMNILTGLVTDTSTFKMKGTLLAPESRRFAKSSLDRVGCGKLTVAGYWGHALLIFMISSMPEWLQTTIISLQLRFGLKVLEERKKYKKS